MLSSLVDQHRIAEGIAGMVKVEILVDVAMQVINPPLFGVIAGVVVGLSPAGPLLFLPPSPSALRMPFELKIVVGEHCSYLRLCTWQGGKRGVRGGVKCEG